MSFEQDLKKLCDKHKVVLSGNLKIRKAAELRKPKLSITSTDCLQIRVGHHVCRDISGTYIVCEYEEEAEQSKAAGKSKAPTVFTDTFTPFVSPVNGEAIMTKRQLRDHEKRNNVVQVGSDFDSRVNKVRETGSYE